MTKTANNTEITAVLPELLDRAGANKGILTLVRHSTVINWRQRFVDDLAMLRNSDSALDTTAPADVVQAPVKRLPGLLPTLIDAAHAQATVISLTSRIRIDGKSAHLSMMNLHPPVRASMDEVIGAIRCVRPKGETGRLFSSGRFYHYYGSSLIKEEGWIPLLAQWLMPSVLVSPRYIGHCIVQGYSALRLSALAPLKPVVPHLVRDWF